MSLRTTIIRQEKAPQIDRERMFALQQRHYDCVCPEIFAADLSDKDWVIQLRDPQGELIGFSTQKVFRTRIDGKERTFLFSGDTIVCPAHWRESTLAGAFGHLMLRVWKETEGDCYWFLITKGFRTYRFLPVFFKRFVPWHGQQGDEELINLLTAVSRSQFGKGYDAETGLIVPGESKDRLCPELAGIPAARLRNPHVRYFLTRNPRYREGVELACLASLAPQNLNRAGQRVIQHTQVEWRE